MFIENLDVKLVKEKEEIKNFMQNRKDEVAKLTKKMEAVEEKYKSKMVRFSEVNAQINDIVIPQVFDKLEEHEIPDQVVVKDGKPFLNVIDIRVDAIKKANEMKKGWKDYIEKRTKVKETIETVEHAKS